MSNMDPDASDLIGKNAFKVAVTDDGKHVGVAIYNVVDDAEHGVVAKYVAGIMLTAEKAYEIAREFSICAMKVEDNAK